MRLENLQDNNWQVPVVCSLFLHGALVVGFFVVLPSSEERKVNPTPSFVTARMVTLEQPRAKPRPQPVRRVASKPAEPKVPVKKTEVKPKPQTDQKAIALKRKQEEDRQKKLTDKKRQEEEERQARQREQDRLERERRELLQKQQDQEMLAALAREQRAAAQLKADELTVEGYEQLIAGLVSAQWSRPPSARRGMRVTLQIRLAPTGEVISIARVSGSGNEAFDRSATQAVERAAPFREIQGMEGRIFERNFREFRFVFNPEDLLE